MHAKYEVSISYGSKVIAKVKVDNRQTNRQTDRRTDKQTGQKQYAPDHSIRGHKNTPLGLIVLRIYFTLRIFQSYCDLEQEIPNLRNGRGKSHIQNHDTLLRKPRAYH